MTTTKTGLVGWDTNLLVHARVADLGAVVALSTSQRVGAVFTTGDTGTGAGLVKQMRGVGMSGPVLLDADRYSGKTRKLAGAGLTASWLRHQHSLGQWALTDSGYVATGDVSGLRVILRASKSAGGGVIAALPLAGSWMDQDLNILLNEIGDAAVPVAFMLEHKEDPFSSQRTVLGVVGLLETAEVPILALRCDVSSLGVLAFGGVAAAVGTRSSLRHIFPVTPTKGGGRPAQIAALFEPALAYRSMDKLTDAIAADPDDPRWRCKCAPCYGRSVEWILNSPNQETEAFRHSIACLRRLADEITAAHLTADERRRSWLAKCQHAQAVSWEIADTSGKSWQPPRALAAWNRAVPATVGR